MKFGDFQLKIVQYGHETLSIGENVVFIDSTILLIAPAGSAATEEAL